MVMLSGLVTAPFGWRALAPEDLGLLALAGLFQGSAHFTLIESFRLAPAAVVAPFKYSSLIWAVLLGFLMFGDLPDTWIIAGSTVVIASGLYILQREARRHRAAAEAAADE